jgi:hypothetical protein
MSIEQTSKGGAAWKCLKNKNERVNGWFWSSILERPTCHRITCIGGLASHSRRINCNKPRCKQRCGRSLALRQSAQVVLCSLCGVPCRADPSATAQEGSNLSTTPIKGAPFASHDTMLIFVNSQKDTSTKSVSVYSSPLRGGTLRVSRSPRVPEACVL